MLAQVALIIKILEKNKFVHGDFHIGNIGYIKTNKKTIKILNYSIPTFGYIYKAIDYGAVLHKSFILTKNDKQKYKNIFGKEFLSIIETVMMDKDKFYDYLSENNIKLNNEKNLKQVMTSELKNIISEYTTNKDFIFTLSEVLYPEIFQKLILGKKFKYIIENKIFFDPIDFIYIITVNLDLDKIVNYSLAKIN